MEFNLQQGINFVVEMVVDYNHTAISYGSGNVQVFATPAMIAQMENAAKSTVEKYLPKGYSTVGTEVNVKHIKATPIGMKVKFEAILEENEGKKLIFKVTAWDEKGKIGEGSHTRYIINVEEFMNKLNNK